MALLIFSHGALALSPRPERVWAIGDLHGDAGCARHWVERTRLISNVSAPPEEWEWTDPSAKLVFMGDYIDRGPEARAVLTFVRELTTRFPDHVHALLGNHELNLLVDRARPEGSGRYLEYAYAAAHPAQYAAWLPEDERAEEGSAEVLRALHEALLLVYRQQLHGQGVLMTPEGPRSVVQFVQPAAMRARVTASLRRWQTAYLRGVGTCTPLGAWVQRPLSVLLADTLFVHGGGHRCPHHRPADLAPSPSRPRTHAAPTPLCTCCGHAVRAYPLRIAHAHAHARAHAHA